MTSLLKARAAIGRWEETLLLLADPPPSTLLCLKVFSVPKAAAAAAHRRTNPRFHSLPPSISPSFPLPSCSLSLTAALSAPPLLHCAGSSGGGVCARVWTEDGWILKSDIGGRWQMHGWRENRSVMLPPPWPWCVCWASDFCLHAGETQKETEGLCSSESVSLTPSIAQSCCVGSQQEEETCLCWDYIWNWDYFSTVVKLRLKPFLVDFLKINKPVSLTILETSFSFLKTEGYPTGHIVIPLETQVELHTAVEKFILLQLKFILLDTT